MPGISKNYQTIAAAKKAQQQSKIPAEWLLQVDRYNDLSNFMEVPTTCGILDHIECDITSSHDATALWRNSNLEIWCLVC